MIRGIEKRKTIPGSEPELDDTYVLSRSEDRSIWIRIAYILEKYKILVWLVGVLLVGLGFDFRTPKAQFDEIKASIQSTREELQTQIDSVKRKQSDGFNARAIEFLIRTKCSDMTDKEIYRLGGGEVCSSATTRHSP